MAAGGGSPLRRFVITRSRGGWNVIRWKRWAWRKASPRGSFSNRPSNAPRSTPAALHRYAMARRAVGGIITYSPRGWCGARGRCSFSSSRMLRRSRNGRRPHLWTNPCVVLLSSWGWRWREKGNNRVMSLTRIWSRFSRPYGTGRKVHFSPDAQAPGNVHPSLQDGLSLRDRPLRLVGTLDCRQVLMKIKKINR